MLYLPEVETGHPARWPGLARPGPAQPSLRAGPSGPIFISDRPARSRFFFYENILMSVNLESLKNYYRRRLSRILIGDDKMNQ